MLTRDYRAESAGELYTYIPLTPGNSSRLLAVPPVSRANADYGFSVGRGSFHLDVAVGKWVSISFRVKMNDIGAENGKYSSPGLEILPLSLNISGEIQVWVDGVSAIFVTRLVLRESENARIKGMHFQTFFGGGLFVPMYSTISDRVVFG